MGALVEAVRSAFGAKANTPQPSGAPPWFNSIGLIGERYYRHDVGDGEHSSIIVASVRWIQRNFPEARLRVRRKTSADLEEVQNEPMTQLVARPNPHYSGDLLWWGTLASWVLDGNSYWRKHRSGAGRPAELWYTPHWMLEPKWDDEGREYITHYEYNPGGGRRFKIEPSEIVHFRHGIDPHNTRKGVSDLKSLLREIYTDEEAARFTAALMRNMGVPGLVMSPATADIEFDDDARESAKLKLMEATTGNARGEPLIMSGPTKLEQFGFTPEQLDLSALRAVPESRITAVLGIPAAVLGLLSGMEQTKVGATMAELREVAYENAIVPMQRLMASELHAQLLSDFATDLDRLVVDFDQSDVRVLQEDETKRVERWVKMVGGPFATLAEGRAEFGLETAEDQNVLMLPMSVMVTPLEHIGEAEEPAPAPPQLLAASRIVPIADMPLLPGRSVPIIEEKAPADITARELRAVRIIERALAPRREKFANETEKRLKTLGSRVAEAYLDRVGKAIATPEEEGLAGEVVRSVRPNEWRDAQLGPLFAGHYVEVASAVYDSLKASLGVDLGVDLPDPIARQVLAEGGTRLGLLDLDAEVRTTVRAVISAAREEGLNPLDIARLLRDTVPAGPFPHAGSAYRAQLIARTETRNAQATASVEAGKAAGFEEFIVLDARLGATDAECEALNGQIVSATEVAGIMASEHPNGTRSALPRARS